VLYRYSEVLRTGLLISDLLLVGGSWVAGYLIRLHGAGLPEPPVAQPLGPFLVITPQQPAEMPAGHPEQLARLVGRQLPLAVALHRFLEPQHQDLP